MNNTKVTYIEYNMNQLQFPTDLSNWIPQNHIARIVNEVVENLDIKILENAYIGGGRSSYHPKMMLKIVLFAYTQKITLDRGKSIHKELVKKTEIKRNTLHSFSYLKNVGMPFISVSYESATF